jgi:hypothetical protein
MSPDLCILFQKFYPSIVTRFTNFS